MRQKITNYKHLSWGPWTALVGTIAIFFVSQILSVLAIYVFLMLRGWDTNRIDVWIGSEVQAPFIFSIVIASTTLGLLATYLHRRRAHPRELGLVRPQLRDIGYTIFGFLGYMALFIFIVSILSQLVPGLDTEQTQELGFSKDTSGDGLLLVFVSLVVLPPIVEEIMVRGFLFPGLRKKLSFLSAAIISSALFGLAHLGGGEGGSAIWIATIDTFILGMVLSYLREKTGSLWAPIAVHAVKNFIAFSFLFIFKDVIL